MQPHDGLLPFWRLLERQTLLRILKAILRQRSRATRVLQLVERCLLVRITVGVVRPELMPRQVLLGSTIQCRSKMVTLRLPRTGVARPAGGIVPLTVGTSRIYMDGYEHDIFPAQLIAPSIDAIDALLQ